MIVLLTVISGPGVLLWPSQTVFAPLATVQQFMGRPRAVSHIQFELKNASEELEEAFLARWEPILAGQT
ncbi:MAG: hypothetical protein HC809_17060, partial [Gammaproteobacteria bacterium]|nr:hypothetical protein [Gammaproteobacteria bacterium]